VQPGVRCALEHGGAAPVIVTENANLSKAVAGIAKGGFYHAGQVCVSTQRVFVERSVCQEFTDLLKQVVLGLKVGDACDNNTDVGPLIREHEVKRVDSWVKEAIEQGAELICGGAPIDNRFYAPTILLNPNENSKVSYQEIFGPVVCIYDYDSLDDALEQANSLEYIFQAGVFSDSLDECMYIYRLLKASAVMINDHSAFREDGMPFAGLKQSGLAVGGIHNAINDMQIEKLMVIKS
jgi:acyl-CoA reductase-like NAD-dependent aldehyde dehydrogenase